MGIGIAPVRTTAIDSPDDRAPVARRVLIEGVSLGCLADYALRAAPGGLGWTLWIAALLLAAVNVARASGLRLKPEQMGWLGAALACAAAFAWRDAEELRVFNVLGTLVSIALFSLSAAGLPVASAFVARLRDLIAAGLYTVRDLIAGTPMLVFRDARLGALPLVRGGTSWSLLRALLLTAPVVLVFAALLSRADPVFASLFILPEIDLARVIPHVFVAGAFSWWSSGWLRGALLGVASRPALPARLPLSLGIAEVTTALGSVIALFAIFVSLQLRWLFSGADMVLATTGLTVAEYARRGFFELVAVSALVHPLVLGTRAAIDDARVIRRHRVLSLALLGLLAAIMASALLRMQLYVGYFGLSTDRLYATAIMLWLAMVSLALALTVLRGRGRPFAAITVLTALATLGGLNLLDPESLIARVNLARPSEVRTVDYAYLARLSGDAMPTVVQALVAAPPSVDACRAAMALQRQWGNASDVAWNIGARRGHEAVAARLSPNEVQRLCSAGTGNTAPGADH